MFSHALSLFLWIVLCNFTQQAMELQKGVLGWLEEATLFPVNKQEVSHQHDLNFSELTFPEDEKAKDRDATFLDIPNVSDILDEDDWMDEKIDLSILDSTFQDDLVTPSSSSKPDALDVATEIDTLVDSYFQSNVFLPFETTESTSFKSFINDIQSSPSTSPNFLIPEAAASLPVFILPEEGLQLPSSPVELTWSASSSPVGRCVPSSPVGRSIPSSPVGTPTHSDGNLSDISEGTNTSERETESPPFTACYVEIVESSSSQQASTTEILKKRASPSTSKAMKVSAQPYSLAPYQLKKESRRERKKVQNKEAAARYRMKKRENDKVLGGEVAELEDKQKSLKEKHDSLKTEIKYLKSLMRDMFKARGILK